jgi:hypothetical protein
LKKYWRLKPPSNYLTPDAQIATQKYKKHKKQSNMTPSKVNSPSIMDAKHSLMDEIT